MRNLLEFVYLAKGMIGIFKLPQLNTEFPITAYWYRFATGYLVSVSVSMYENIMTIKRFRITSICVHVIVVSKIHFTSSHFTSRIY